MNTFFLLETANPGGWEQIGTLLIMIVPIALAMYFFVMRPQKKQEKTAKDMRDSLAVGDTVTTNGGIVGIIVKIKGDMMLLETGANRTLIQVKKWCVHTIDEKGKNNKE